MNFSRRQRFRNAAILVGAAVFASALAARADWVVDAVGGFAYNSNLTRAQDAQDRRPDRALTFNVAVARHEVLGGYDGLAIAIDLHGEVHDRYRGLDFAGVGAGVAYRRKFGLGRSAPYAILAGSAAYDDYREDVRDGSRLEGRIELGWRPRDPLDVSAGLGFDRRHARTNIPVVPGVSGAIFDLRGASAFVRGELTLDDRWALGFRYQVRRGDVESTSQRGKSVFLASDAIASDPAFEDPLLTGYRLRGTTRTAGFKLSYALSQHAAIDLGYTDERTHAARDLRYRGRIADAVFIHRF